MKKLVLLGLLFTQVLWAQSPKGMLLQDIALQIEVTESMNAMYNFKFEEAEKTFTALKNKYSHHPLPFFLLGLSAWWKIVPEIDDTVYDQQVFAYMDTAIALGEKLYKEDSKNYEATFFLAAAHAFKGRLYIERDNWVSAMLAGKEALKYAELTKGKHHFAPELLLGDALYNYYSVWIRENYPLLRPILTFFEKGDKALGTEQLKTVARNSFYTRTEAQYFLLDILADEEKNYEEGLQLAHYLSTTFPDNPYFERYYAKLLYITGRFSEAVQVSLHITEKLAQQKIGYGPTSGRYANFFLGHIYELQGNLAEAKHYYHSAKQWSEMAGDTDSGYYHYALLGLGNIAAQEDSVRLAKNYYQTIKKLTKRKSTLGKLAREHIAKLTALRKGKSKKQD